MNIPILLSFVTRWGVSHCHRNIIDIASVDTITRVSRQGRNRIAWTFTRHPGYGEIDSLNAYYGLTFVMSVSEGFESSREI